MRLCYAVLLSGLAACPRGGGGGPQAPLGVGCPEARDVFVASYVTPDEGVKGYTGWVLPLHDKVVETLDGVPEYTNLDAAAASAAGVPAPPPSVWLLGGPQPCRATVGAYYAAAVKAQTPNVTYGVELAGCAAPPDPASASAIVVVSDSPPSECQIVPPRGIAQRLGELDEKTGAWSRPAKETPIPPALAGQVPPKPCTAPCEMLWSFAQVEHGGKPVAWAGAVNWVETTAATAPAEQCQWKSERWSGYFVAGPDGAPVRVTEGQEHPLALTAVLADKAGARVLVAEGPGEYSTYDLTTGGAPLGRHLVWLRPDPESYEVVDHLGPVCPESP